MRNLLYISYMSIKLSKTYALLPPLIIQIKEMTFNKDTQVCLQVGYLATYLYFRGIKMSSTKKNPKSKTRTSQKTLPQSV